MGQREREGDPIDALGRLLAVPRSSNNPGLSSNAGGSNARDSSRRLFGGFGLGEPSGLRIIRPGDGHRPQAAERVRADPGMI